MKTGKDLFPELTDQQAYIATIIAEECLRAKEISNKIFISVTTVQNHIRDIKEKLKLKSNMEIVREYYKRMISSMVAILLFIQVFSLDPFYYRRRVRYASRRFEYEYSVNIIEL